jgi:MFS family permease
LIWIAGGATVAQALLLLSGRYGLVLFWPAILGLGATAVAWNAVAMVAVVRTSESGGTGRASGTVLTGFFAGLLVSPVIAGSMVDRTGSYAVGWAVITALFAAAAALAGVQSRYEEEIV